MVGIVALVLSIPAPAQEKSQDKASIVGVWEVVKSDEAPAGSTVEFTRNGKLILISKSGDKTKRLEATYQLEDLKLVTKRTEGGKEEVNMLTIQTLNKSTLVTINEKGKVEELKRKTQ